jgi:predicted dehydrogenase
MGVRVVGGHTRGAAHEPCRAARPIVCVRATRRVPHELSAHESCFDDGLVDTQLRGAIVGYGFIASEGHLPAYLERARQRGDVSIVAVADACAGRRAAALERAPGVRVYSDHESLFAAESSRLDFVDIATPPADHAAIARAALRRGLHVLCEKPLATSAHDAWDLLRTARLAERVVFPCHNYLYAPVVRAVRGVLDRGLIGRPTMATLHTYRSSHGRGVREWRPDWRRDRRIAGGGITMDHGVHAFYVAFDWLGGYPTAVTARMSVTSGYDTEDSCTCTLTFPDGIASTHLTWTAGARKAIYTISGERGVITVNDDDMQVVWTEDGRAREERASVPSHFEDASHTRWFGAVLERFRVSVLAREFVGRAALDAARCLEVIEAVYASARDGCCELPVERLST